jgi:hypothetical protein
MQKHNDKLQFLQNDWPIKGEKVSLLKHQNSSMVYNLDTTPKINLENNKDISEVDNNSQ